MQNRLGPMFLLVLLCWWPVIDPADGWPGQSLKKKWQRRLQPVRYNPEAHMDTVELIEHRGYRAETHLVTTGDGYILELHRIPNAKGRPVLLQHGVIEGSSLWVINPTASALPFVLADRGYDVWLGNNRGNVYARKHVRLDPDEAEFWDFSWDEMGYYDIPATINYILATTGWPKLSYVGHSLGCGVFFIAMATHPKLNAKVDVMMALAPSTSVGNYSNYLIFLKPFFPMIGRALSALGFTVILSNENLSQVLHPFCTKNYLLASVCSDAMMSLVGFNRRNFDLRMTPSVIGHLPLGTSINTIVQFSQNHRAGETFQAFDHGPEENERRYGTPEPFVYDLTQVQVPVSIFYSENDLVVNYRDVLWLADQLPNVQGLILASDERFSHMDFLLGTNVKSVVYDQLTELLPPPQIDEPS